MLDPITAASAIADMCDQSPLGMALAEKVATAPVRQPGCLICVGGLAGTGKTTLARWLSDVTGWACWDKDNLGALIDRCLRIAGGAAATRESDLYRNEIRPDEYRCFLDPVLDHVSRGIPAIADAPFISEMTDPTWMQETAAICEAARAAFFPIWVTCDPDTTRRNLQRRGAERDRWKLNHWDQYMAGLDIHTRPAGPHILIDNSSSKTMR